MDPPVSLALVAAGAGALYFGSNWLVDGAAGLALRYGVRPLVIGLTIIALGTSSPEAILALVTSLEGHNQLSLGNVIGANISNLALVFGVGCLIRPLAMKLSRMWREAAFLLLSGPLLALLALDGRLDRVDGLVMFGVISAFFFTLYSGSCRGDRCAVVEEEQELVQEIRVRSTRLIGALIVAGTVFLAVGAQAIIEGATGLARSLGVGDQIIGLTLVAVGTTIPELTIAITASRKGHSDVVLGNIIGTVIVNTLFVLGIGALIAGFDMSAASTWAGIAVMIFFSTLLVVLLAAMDRAKRRTGAFVLTLYFSYIVLMVLLFG
jgi:cation:H+ antiporter